MIERKIYVQSLRKVKEFLEKQDKPVLISKIFRETGLDTTTIRKAFEYLNIEKIKEGKKTKVKINSNSVII